MNLYASLLQVKNQTFSIKTFFVFSEISFELFYQTGQKFDGAKYSTRPYLGGEQFQTSSFHWFSYERSSHS